MRTKIFWALHKIVLTRHSPVFETMINSQFKEAKSSEAPGTNSSMYLPVAQVSPVFSTGRLPGSEASLACRHHWLRVRKHDLKGCRKGHVISATCENRHLLRIDVICHLDDKKNFACNMYFACVMCLFVSRYC